MNAPISTLLAGKRAVIHAIPLFASVQEAVELMNRHKIGSIVVMDGGRLAGIFTERDALQRVLATGISPSATGVAAVMTKDPRTITPETTMQEALALISEKRIRHLPVIEGGRMVGMISQGDITHWLVEAHRAQAEQLMDYIVGNI